MGQRSLLFLGLGSHMDLLFGCSWMMISLKATCMHGFVQNLSMTMSDEYTLR